jgi:hypothetical protein
MKPINLVTESGIYLGRAMAGLWDSEAHDKVIERTIRGLYYHHYGSILGDSAKIKVQWLKGEAWGQALHLVVLKKTQLASSSGTNGRIKAAGGF